jgi:hypothetical protein
MSPTQYGWWTRLKSLLAYRGTWTHGSIRETTLMFILTRYPNGTFYSRSEKKYLSLSVIRARQAAGDVFKVVCSKSFDDLTARYLKPEVAQALKEAKLFPCEMCGERRVANPVEDTVCDACDEELLEEEQHQERKRLKAMKLRPCRACQRPITTPHRYFHCVICLPEDERSGDEGNFVYGTTPASGPTGKREGEADERAADTKRLRKLMRAKGVRK